MGATRTTVLPALKEHYLGKTVAEVFYKASNDINPLMAAMDAIADDGEGMGRVLVVPFVYGTGTARGQSFTKVLAKAQGSTTGSAASIGRWEIQPVTQEAVASWTREAMTAAETKGPRETFRVMSVEMDTKIEAIRKQISTYAFGDGTGALAQIVAVSSTGFTVAADRANRFVVGMDVSTCTTATGAVKNSGGTPNLLVTGVDYLNSSGTATIYTSTDPSSSAGRTAQAANDYVFDYNDRPNAGMAAYANYVLPWGMDAWLPGATVVDSTTFCGNTRDGQSILAGLTIGCGSLDPENALLNAAALLFNAGGIKADMGIMNPNDYAAWIADKDKSKTVSISLGKFELGFDGFNLHSLAGNIPIVPDAQCPSGTFYLGPFKNPQLAPRLVYTGGSLVNIDDKDGLDFVRSASATNYEMRLFFNGNIAFPAPGKFVRGTSLTI